MLPLLNRLSKRKATWRQEQRLCCYQWACVRAQSFVGWDPGGWDKKDSADKIPQESAHCGVILKTFYNKAAERFQLLQSHSVFLFQRDIWSVRQFARRLKIQFPWASGVQIQNTLQLRIKSDCRGITSHFVDLNQIQSHWLRGSLTFSFSQPWAAAVAQCRQQQENTSLFVYTCLQHDSIF